nr:hypothetical protein CFP56_64044 [Quercus suber]
MCTSSYIGKKLMKKVRRQPNMKLKDIQDVVHEKLTLNITLGKVGRAREKVREYVDKAHTQQYNKLWEYCEELKRASPDNTILMKVHTFNEGDLATEMDLRELVEDDNIDDEEFIDDVYESNDESTNDENEDGEELNDGSNDESIDDES